MAASVAFVGVLILVGAISSPAFAADHTVGGGSGWDSGVDYTAWAAGETFNAKDTVSFSYTGLHSVHQVSKADYESCSSSNAISSGTTGTSSFTLDKPGTTYYFICGTTSHCLSGMKLAVTTAGGSAGGASGGSSTPSTPTTPAVARGNGGYSYGAAAPAAGGTAAVVLVGVVAGLVAAAF